MKQNPNINLITIPNFNFSIRNTPITETEICKVLLITPMKLKSLQREMRLVETRSIQVYERSLYECRNYNFWDLYELSLGIFPIYSEYFINMPDFRYEVVDSMSTVYEVADETGRFELEAVQDDMNGFLRQYLYDSKAELLDYAFARSALDCLFKVHARLNRLDTWKAEFKPRE